MNKRQRDKHLGLFGYRLEDGEIKGTKAGRMPQTRLFLPSHPRVRRRSERLHRAQKLALPALLRSCLSEGLKAQISYRVESYVPNTVPWTGDEGRPRKRLYNMLRRFLDVPDLVDGDTIDEARRRETKFFLSQLRANPKLLGKRI